MLEFISWLGLRRGQDSNAISEFERSLFSMVLLQHVPNTAFLSLRMQLREWLLVSKVSRVPGLPNWWHRKIENKGVVLAQSRIIGGDYSLPKEMCPVTIAFEVSVDGDQGTMTFLVDESVQHVLIEPADIVGTSKPGSVEVGLPRVGDDSDYWLRHAASFGDLKPISNALLAFLKQQDFDDQNPVVFAARGAEEPPEIEGFSLPLTYARLLLFANGIRVNNVLIWGIGGSGRRLASYSGKEFLYIGESSGGLLALEIDSGQVGEQVICLGQFSAGPVAANVIALCESALYCAPSVP